MESFRQAKGSPDIGDWPDWCWLPMAAAYAVVSGGGRLTSPAQALDVSAVAALAAWRLGQGVYRFDPALYGPVCDTPMAGDIPHEVLHRLPEWAVYIETPGLASPDDGVALHGAYVHLEYDVARDGRTELRLLLDTDLALLPVPLHLGHWPLAESLARATDQARANAVTRGITLGDAGANMARTVECVRPIVSLVLYLCSQAAEIGVDGRLPAKAGPVKVKAGLRWFAAEKPAVWDVGVRIGAALRRAAHAAETHQGPPTGATVRPHIRRAHWHTILSGRRVDDAGQPIPAAARKADLRWLPPIPVALTEGAELPVTVRPVRPAPPTV